MKIKTESQVEVTAESLAEHLWMAGPEYFANFWFAFARSFAQNPTIGERGLDEIAKALASPVKRQGDPLGQGEGGTLERLADLVAFHKEAAARIR